VKSTVLLAAAIIAAALIAAVGLYLYFSPYHSCVRALAETGYEPADAALACLQGIEPEESPGPARPFTSALATPRTP
jgi:hypothetical protein